jgi:hypothetical protein
MSMSKKRRLTFVVCFALATAWPVASGESARLGIADTQIVSAINKDICFDRFWGRGTYNDLHSTVRLSVSRGPDRVDAWSEKLSGLRGRFVTHFIIKANRGITFVDSSESYNERSFPQMIARLRTPDHINLPIAMNCQPSKVKNSAKTRLIQKIATHELASIYAFTHRPKPTSIVIANVDESYPDSLVYVPSTDKLFTVTVIPGTSYVYTADGPYLFGQDKGSVAKIRAKILKYGLQMRLR